MRRHGEAFHVPRAPRMMLALALAFATLRPLDAQQVVLYPSPPSSAAAAAASYDERARVAVAWNACSREDDYGSYRTEMANGDYGDEGENLSGILIGKVAYVLAQRQAGTDVACLGRIVRTPPAGVSLSQFAIDDRIVRARWPNGCMRERAESAQPNLIDVDVAVTPACMIVQINEAIRAMHKTTVLGSSNLVCLETATGKSQGEFDTNVRELMRIFYLAGPHGRSPGILEPATVDWMYAKLFAARNGPSDDSYSVLAGCSAPAGDELGTPEDTADRHAWYRELSRDIGDFFDWLFKFIVLTTAHALADVALSAAPFLLLVDPNDSAQALLPHADVRVQETENHRLQIETSRYLTNAAIIERLTRENYDRTDEVVADQAAVHDWLLRRLQDIAAHDFREYNARPYTRYSLNAIQNLYDFAAVRGDARLAVAAHDVLDLSEAKFAATANRGRRLAPYRRRAEYDGFDLSDDDHRGTANLYDIVIGGDHEVARNMLYANQTQLVPASSLPAVMTQIVDAASSTYRLPPPVLAADVGGFRGTQTIVHAGVERVFAAPAWTIGAGGVRTPPTTSLAGHAADNDRGVAMPTAIVPTLAGTQNTDVFRFDGIGIGADRPDNTCVASGFACGVEPRIPAAYAACTHATTTLVETHAFVDSSECFPGPGPHFYLAAFSRECTNAFCDAGHRWGFMEIVAATASPVLDALGRDVAFDTFTMGREIAMATVSADPGGRATYVDTTGRRIDFDVAQRGPAIVALDGVPTAPWTTAGGLIEADGNGRATIGGPGGITIDFSDWSNPKRSP